MAVVIRLDAKALPLRQDWVGTWPDLEAQDRGVEEASDFFLPAGLVEREALHEHKIAQQRLFCQYSKLVHKSIEQPTQTTFDLFDGIFSEVFLKFSMTPYRYSHLCLHGL